MSPQTDLVPHGLSYFENLTFSVQNSSGEPKGSQRSSEKLGEAQEKLRRAQGSLEELRRVQESSGELGEVQESSRKLRRDEPPNGSRPPRTELL